MVKTIDVFNVSIFYLMTSAKLLLTQVAKLHRNQGWSDLIKSWSLLHIEQVLLFIVFFAENVQNYAGNRQINKLKKEQI